MKPWTITIDDDSWTDENVTVAHVIAVTELVGDEWAAYSPWNGPKVLAAWMAVLVASRTADLEAAVQKIYALPIATFDVALTEREPTEPA